jgi:hypothetical protein
MNASLANKPLKKLIGSDVIKRLLATFIIAFLSLLINGCVSFENRPLNLVASVARVEARSLSNPPLRQFIHSSVGDKKS